MTHLNFTTNKKTFSNKRLYNNQLSNLSDTIYCLMGIVLLKKDKGTDLEICNPSNAVNEVVLSASIRGSIYCFQYKSSSDTIEIREDSSTGQLILLIEENTSAAEVNEAFN